MAYDSEIADAFVLVATDVNNLEDDIGDLPSLSTTAKTDLVSAINEIFAGGGSGGVAVLDDLTDVTITSPATDHILRFNGSVWVNNLGSDIFQPTDSDLTAIAALTTTSYGRAFLELANQAALMALIQAASTTVAGKVELADSAETISGASGTLAVTPSGFAAAIADLISTATDLGGATPSNAKVPSQAAVKAYADALIAAANGMVFKGVIDASTNPNYPAADAGHLYRISVAGKIGGAAGVNVEVGDEILCLVDGSVAGTQAAVGANWNVTQANVDGAVVGPSSSVSGDFATFSGTTGKVVQDSGLSLDTNVALGASDVKIPSQNAVKTYADTKQAAHVNLTELAGLSLVADRLPYADGADSLALTVLTAFGRTLIASADAAAARTALDVYSKAEIGDPTTDFAQIYTDARA